MSDLVRKVERFNEILYEDKVFIHCNPTNDAYIFVDNDEYWYYKNKMQKYYTYLSENGIEIKMFKDKLYFQDIKTDQYATYDGDKIKKCSTPYPNDMRLVSDMTTGELVDEIKKRTNSFVMACEKKDGEDSTHSGFNGTFHQVMGLVEVLKIEIGESYRRQRNAKN